MEQTTLNNAQEPVPEVKSQPNDIDAILKVKRIRELVIDEIFSDIWKCVSDGVDANGKKIKIINVKKLNALQLRVSP